jgi:hypothetical protein
MFPFSEASAIQFHFSTIKRTPAMELIVLKTSDITIIFQK